MDFRLETAAPLRVAESGLEAIERLALHAPDGEARSHPVERLAHVEQMHELVRRELPDENPLIGDAGHEEVPLQKRERLADRRPAHAETARQLGIGGDA